MLKSELNDEDIQRLLSEARDSFFETFKEIAHGAIAINSELIILWMDNQYLNFLGISDKSMVIGKPISDVLPTSLLPQVVESGVAQPLDIMEYPHGWAVVSRFPLRNEQDQIIGGFGFVLFDALDRIHPLLAKVKEMSSKLTKVQSELARERSSKFTFSQFIGTSKPILEIKRQARLAANSRANVLICGPTGTGKEMLAQAIHSASPRANNNFVAINMAAIPEPLLEAELFGAAVGSYTGQGKNKRVGKIALADKGTLFLDEIGDMPITTQVKLLRAIQEKEIEALGSNTVQKVDIRIIAATSQDVLQLMDDGFFRADLYYRLNVIAINIPPLADHIEDLTVLAESLLDVVARENESFHRGITDDAIKLMSKYTWPGNIRELKNVLERACVFSTKKTLDVDDVKMFLPEDLTPEFKPEKKYETGNNLQSEIAPIEYSLILRTLAENNGNKTKSAKQLGISRSNLYLKLKEYNIK